MTSIVKITELELGSFRQLRDESSREGFKFIERLCEEWISGANRFDAPGEALFVAVVDGQVVGVCGLNRDPYTSNPRIGRVRRLYVASAHRRHGIGRALLRSVVRHARSHFGLLRVRTDEASQFYEAQGFRRAASETESTHVLELSGSDFGL
jgi:GNAT superfamily N-acetyltransferase